MGSESDQVDFDVSPAVCASVLIARWKCQNFAGLLVFFEEAPSYRQRVRVGREGVSTAS
jgi:hypothetical protein